MLTANDEERRPSTTVVPVATLRRRSAVRFQARRRRRARPKKRHVESMTRLPTKRMATACWVFIVVKTPRPQVAPRLDFSTLQRANTNSIHRLSTNGCGRPGGNFGRSAIAPRSPPSPLIEALGTRSACARRISQRVLTTMASAASRSRSGPHRPDVPASSRTSSC